MRDRLVTEVKEAFRNTGDAEGHSDPSGGHGAVELPTDAKQETMPVAEASVAADEPEAPPFVGSAQVKEPPRTAPAADPIPARMLNEFVYCPRLFYYEYVEGVFVDNADTTRGAVLHARVDKGSGALPMAPSGNPAAESEDGEAGEPLKPKAEAEKIHSHSVTLGSDRLGVIAKLDLVEVRASDAESDLLSRLEVCPVDYKAGAPREGEDGNELWPTDRMQLGLQILILRDNGYRCDRGIIYYRTTKQRVPLEWTSELETWVTAQIESARQTMAGPIPPPLVGSPKCLRCSLNSVCLPDETRLLATRAAEIWKSGSVESEGEASRTPPLEMISAGQSTFNSQQATNVAPRRLISPRDDTRVLYLNTPGVRVGRKDELLTVKDEERTLNEVRIADISHVALFGNIQISTQAVQMLCEREVPITYFSMGAGFTGSRAAMN